MSTLAALNAFWQARNPRERRLFLGAGLVLGATFLFVGAYEPLTARVSQLEASLPRLRAEARQMRVQTDEIERLRGQAEAAPGRILPLAQQATASAAPHAFGDLLTLEVVDAAQLRIRLQSVPAEAWLAWQGDLARHGIHAQQANIRLEARPGFVTVEATLTGDPH